MNDQDDQSPPAWLRSHGRGWNSGPPKRVFDNPWFAVDDYEAVAPTGKLSGAGAS